MANSPANKNRLSDGGFNLVGGVNSYHDPQLLSDKHVAWAINLTNRGGRWSLRPGYKSIARMPDGRAQGMTIFTPSNDVPTMVVAVSGRIWVSRQPFTAWAMLPNIQFDAYVDQVVFKEALQSVNSGVAIAPTNLLIMQDGRSKAAYWDGSTDRHLNPGSPQFETPQGMWMEYIGGRLWVARGAEIFASDIFDPLHFTETTYLTGGGSLLTMDGNPVTALVRTADNKALLAGTIENTTIIAAANTDRNSWQTTVGFISLLFPGVGWVGGKAYTYSNGELFWMSKEGLRRFTQVGATIQVSKSAVASSEMDRSFNNLSPVLDRCCAFGFNGFVGMSVPSGDVFNRHTWVIDLNTQIMAQQDAPPAWQGIWMGTRPVEWITKAIDGKDRCFHLSQDLSGAVIVWEAFQKNQKDDDGRIYFSLETKGMTFNEPLSFKRFLYSELHLFGLRGQLELALDYRSEYTCWKNLLDASLCAEECHQLECTHFNQAAGLQNRYIKTQEAQHECSDPQLGPYADEIGTYFQNRIRGYGRFGLVKYRSFSNQYPESSTGACSVGDLDENDVLVCKPLLCCDMEVNYQSRSNINPYGYNSSVVTEGSI